MFSRLVILFFTLLRRRSVVLFFIYIPPIMINRIHYHMRSTNRRILFTNGVILLHIEKLQIVDYNIYMAIIVEYNYNSQL